MKAKLLFLFFLFTAVTQAQDVKKSLKLAMEDMSAKTYRVLDANDDPCALVKVHFQKLPSLSFEGDIVETPQKKTSEYWVYLTHGAEYLTIKSNDFSPIQVDFPFPLEKECTYILTIELPSAMTMEEAKEMVKGDAEMKFQTVKVSRNVGRLSQCILIVQMPEGNSLVDKRIREFIIDELEHRLDDLNGGNTESFFNGDNNDDEEILGFYAAEIAKNHVQYAKNMYNENKSFYDTERYCYVYYDSISIADEFDEYITLQEDIVLDCGGHEVYPEQSYHSFRKSDGRLLGIDMVLNNKLEDFYSAVINKVMSTLDEDTLDEIVLMSGADDGYSTQEIIQCLQSLINDNGLEMYVNKDGVSVVFTYSGAAGDDISHIVIFTKDEIQKYIKSTLRQSYE